MHPVASFGDGEQLHPTEQLPDFYMIFGLDVARFAAIDEQCFAIVGGGCVESFAHLVQVAVQAFYVEAPGKGLFLIPIDIFEDELSCAVIGQINSQGLVYFCARGILVQIKGLQCFEDVFVLVQVVRFGRNIHHD